MVIKGRINTFILLAVLFLPIPAFSQSNIQIIHQAYTAKDLPTPGLPISLKVSLSNTRAIAYKLKTYLEIDGKHIPVPDESAELDELDRPSYKVRTFSPLMGMTYMFAIESPDGQVIANREFSLKRDCIPEINPVKRDLEKSPDAKTNLQNQVLRVKKLEGEIRQYERAIILSDELRHLISELGTK